MTIEAITFDLGCMPPVEVQLASAAGLAPLSLPDAIRRFQSAMEEAPELPEGVEEPKDPRVVFREAVATGHPDAPAVTGKPVEAPRAMVPEAPKVIVPESTKTVAPEVPVKPEGPAVMVEAPVVAERPVEAPRTTVPEATKAIQPEETSKVIAPEAPKTVVPEATQVIKPEVMQTIAPDAPKAVVKETPKTIVPDAPKTIVTETSQTISPEAPKVVVAPEAPQAIKPEVAVKPEIIVEAPVKREAPVALVKETVKKPEAPVAIDVPLPQAAVMQAAPVVQPDVVQAAASARTAVIVETVNEVVEAVAAQISVTPALTQGEGEVRIVLKPTVLDGSEIKLSAKEGTLTVAIAPSTPESAQVVSVALPKLETALAEHASMFNHVAVVVATAKKGKTNETA